MSPVLYAPKNNRPLLADPRPHRRQNAIPVGAIVGVYQSFGRFGFGPLLLVSCGEVPLQFSFGPHPSVRALMIRFSSSLHSGPFSVSHSRPVRGSNANPKEFRTPYAQIRLRANGLPAGIPPEGVIRRIFPPVTLRFWALLGSVLSPMTAYSIPSGPNRIR